MSICHTEESWLATLQGSHMARLPIVSVEKVVHEENNSLHFPTTKLTPMNREEWYRTHASRIISRLMRLSKLGQEEWNKYHGTVESGKEEVISNGIGKIAKASIKELRQTYVALA